MSDALTATSTVSGLTGALAYLILLAFTLLNLRSGVTGRALLLSSVVTLIYICAATLAPQSASTQVAEILFELSWIFFIARILRFDVTDPASGTPSKARHPAPVRKVLILAAVLGLIGIVTSVWQGQPGTPYQSAVLQLHTSIQILISTLGLILLEQVIRNGRELYEWRSRIVNIGLGVVFTYALFKHALELLFRTPAFELTVIHGFILALAVPLFIVGSLRNRNNPLRINVSHQFVFRTGTLLFSGLFLLLVGVLGYYARLFGDWFTALYAVVATAAVIGFAVLFGSRPLRRRLRVAVSKALFEYKYDYREEWLRLSARMSERSADLNLAQQGIESLLNVLGSYAGAIWRLSEGQRLLPVAHLNVSWREPLPPTISAAILTFLDDQPWVLDLHNLPPEAQALQDFNERTGLASARYLIPMYAGKKLFGIAILDAAPKSSDLNWEDYDLLKLVANQVAQLLGLQMTGEALQESRQFQAVNQISAFIVHDLKTVSAQLELMVHNAARHRGNPDFVDDMVATVSNSVSRMHKLLEQLRSSGQAQLADTDLTLLLQELQQQFSSVPTVQWDLPASTVSARVNAQQLRSSLVHLLNNAVAACAPEDTIRVHMRTAKEWVTIEITDTGTGMTEQFVKDRLFQPFDSTKGVAGMGIGAFQAREYLRSMGGDLQVDSEPGVGTTFVARLASGEPLTSAGRVTADDRQQGAPND